MEIKNLLTENAYAEMRGVCVRTVQRERARREGPPYIKLGRKVFYRQAAIDAWLLDKEQAQPRATR